MQGWPSPASGMRHLTLRQQFLWATKELQRDDKDENDVKKRQNYDVGEKDDVKEPPFESARWMTERSDD